MVAIIVAQVLLFLYVSEGHFLHDNARDVMKESMKPYKNWNDTTSLFKLWEMASSGLQCCGVDGYDDFFYEDLKCYAFPWSCFKADIAHHKNLTFDNAVNIAALPEDTNNSTINYKNYTYENETYSPIEETFDQFIVSTEDFWSVCPWDSNKWHIRDSNMNSGCFETLTAYLKDKYQGWVIGIFSGILIFEVLLIGFAGAIKTNHYVLSEWIALLKYD